VTGPGLSTARKMAVARGLFLCVQGLRRLAGRTTTEVSCRRRGAHWSLDIREGVQLALYLGVYERATSRRLLEFARPGSIVLDVGANIGAHTLPLARAVGSQGRVVAVEPTDSAFARLVRNRSLNPDLEPRIVTVQSALGPPGAAAADGYYSSWPLQPVASRHPILRGTRHAATGAKAVTLDDLVASLNLPRVDLVKIDVDGGELEVLAGAGGVIARDSPTVVFEACPYLLAERGRTLDELLAYFLSRDYELLDEASLRPVGDDLSKIAAAIPEGGSQNLVARRAAPRP
jgi:FkbM family methyltransferase